MTRWFVPAALAVILTCGGPLAISPAAAASAQATAQQASTGLTARRHDRRNRAATFRAKGLPGFQCLTTSAAKHAASC